MIFLKHIPFNVLAPMEGTPPKWPRSHKRTIGLNRTTQPNPTFKCIFVKNEKKNRHLLNTLIQEVKEVKIKEKENIYNLDFK